MFTSGVPSSTQKLKCRSLKVLLQVGQRFTFASLSSCLNWIPDASDFIVIFVWLRLGVTGE
jgi:hypothetical protein